MMQRRPCAASACAWLLALLATACATTPIDDWRPALAFGKASHVTPDAASVRRLQLIGADLVAVLVQVPGMAPPSTTLQVSMPATAFGLVLVRALEDAGYGLQRVSADQGANYVGYRRRVSETDAGQVLDFAVSIGRVSISREYTVTDDAVYPASLMVIEGVTAESMPVVDDGVFREQGGDHAFVTGIRDTDGAAVAGSVRETLATEADALPLPRRTRARDIVADARLRAMTRDAATQQRPLDPHDYRRLRRTVLIFQPDDTGRMGAGNKQAVRMMMRDVAPGDRFMITACTDMDGRNERAHARGLRVRHEFLSHGIDGERVQLAPCVRASFRHDSDDSPVPVEVVQHRRVR